MAYYWKNNYVLTSKLFFGLFLSFFVQITVAQEATVRQKEQAAISFEATSDAANTNTSTEVLEFRDAEACNSPFPNYINTGYNQSGIISTQFLGNDPLDAETADDFMTPAGCYSSICVVEFEGFISPGSAISGSAANQVIVKIYEDDNALPGQQIFMESFILNDVYPTADGMFKLNLTDVPALEGDSRYWISVLLDVQSASPTERWNWGTTNTRQGEYPALINPGGGFGNIALNWASFPSLSLSQYGGMVMNITFSEADVEGLPCGWEDGEGTGLDCAGGTFVDADGDGITIESDGCYSGSSSQDAAASIFHDFCGDGEFIAHIDNIDPFSWAGLTLRESDAPGAKMIGILSNGTNFARRIARVSTNGAAISQNYFAPNRRWVRLTRSGNTFRSYVSSNGTQWKFAAAKTISMSACIKATLQVSSYNANGNASATFDNVSINDSPLLPLVDGNTNNGETQITKATSNDLNLFPNPIVDGAINVHIAEAIAEEATLLIQNAFGQVVYRDNISLDTGFNALTIQQQLGNGLYILSIKGNTNRFSKKFIVQ